jgi:hypothetical protein
MVFDFPTSDNFEIVSELIEYPSNRKEHERYIDPKLIEINIVTYPRLVSNHDTDVDKYEKCKSASNKSRNTEFCTLPSKHETYKKKDNTCTETDIRIESNFFEKNIDRTE